MIIETMLEIWSSIQWGILALLSMTISSLLGAYLFELERGAAKGGGARERDFFLSVCVSLTEMHRFSSPKRAGKFKFKLELRTFETSLRVFFVFLWWNCTKFQAQKGREIQIQIGTKDLCDLPKSVFVFLWWNCTNFQAQKGQEIQSWNWTRCFAGSSTFRAPRLWTIGVNIYF